MGVRAMRKSCAVLIAVALLLTVPTGVSQSQAAAKTKVQTKKVSVEVGKTKKISIKGRKAKHTYRFVSKNRKIALVTAKGVVKGVKSGKTTIVVKDSCQKKGKKVTKTLGNVKVTVKQPVNEQEKKAVETAATATITPTVVPTASAVPATSDPTSVPTQTPDAEPEQQYEKLDLSKVELADYVESTKSISAKDVEFFRIKLDYDVAVNGTLWVKIKGTCNGTVGFRSWLVNSGNTTLSNQWEAEKEEGFQAPGSFEYEYQLTATNEAAYLFFKGREYGTNIDDLTLTSIEVAYPDKPEQPQKVEPIDPYAPKNEQEADTEKLVLTKTYSQLKLGITGNNPLFTQSFMADPTAVEYNGRLYIYGTHDVIEFNNSGKPVSNAYNTDELHVISSADLVNWTDHGTIDVGEIASWAKNSWAPTVTKKEINGQTKFFIYFANGGNGIGVIEGDSPLGPWKAPTEGALISRNTPNCSVSEVPWLFDPAVLVDDDGSAYLYFGGGTGVSDSDTDEVKAAKNANPKSARVVKLGDDMVSLDGDPVQLDPSYLFEDSEINKINGKYVYSYCTNWSNKGSEIFGSAAAISYMISDKPMTGFEQQGTLFANPGTVFGNTYNNHHKLIEFKGQYYIIYHTTLLEKAMYNTSCGYRTLHMDKVDITEENGTLSIQAVPTYEGLSSVADLNPYEETIATTMAWNGGIKSAKSESLNAMVVDSIHTGDWIGVNRVAFGEEGAKKLSMNVASDSDEGSIEIYLDASNSVAGGKKIGTIALTNTGSSDTYKTLTCDLSETVTGTHKVYFVFRGKGYHIASWLFEK